MNDPMEGLHRESFTLRESPNHDKLVQRAIDIRSTLGIASFSETNKNEPMWAHYAGEFRGICVSYSFSQLRKKISDESQFVRMFYTEDAPILVASGMTAAQKARVLLSAKSLKWSNEREWRLIQSIIGQASYSDASIVKGIYLGARIEKMARQEILDRMRPLHIPVYDMLVDGYQITYTRSEKPSATIKRASRARKNDLIK